MSELYVGLIGGMCVPIPIYTILDVAVNSQHSHKPSYKRLRKIVIFTSLNVFFFY